MQMDETVSPLVSVIVPAFNEAGTIGEVIRRVAAAAPFSKEIIVVDDGSTDGTAEASAEFGVRNAESKKIDGDTEVLLLRHGVNRGKGAAVRTGLSVARGEYVIVQDADLEYDPADYPRLLEPFLAGEADVVYGSRYLSRVKRQETRVESHARGHVKGSGVFFARSADGSRCPGSAEPLQAPAKKTPDPVGASFRWGVKLLNSLVRVLYGVRLTDEATCYKVFRRADLLGMDLQCERFEFCPEVTAKACRLGLKIVEVPIRYTPRSPAEGKKIRWRDGYFAARELWKWRRWTPPPAPVMEPNARASGAAASAKPHRPAVNI